MVPEQRLSKEIAAFMVVIVAPPVVKGSRMGRFSIFLGSPNLFSSRF